MHAWWAIKHVVFKEVTALQELLELELMTSLKSLNTFCQGHKHGPQRNVIVFHFVFVLKELAAMFQERVKG